MPKRNSRNTSEKLPFSWRGTWAHPDLLNLFTDGRIQAEEVLLALLVDSMVKTRGIGCWASNQRIGDILKITPRHVQRLVKNLLDLHVLLFKGYVKKNGRNFRLLETAWSRIRQPPHDIYDTGGASSMSPRSKDKIQDDRTHPTLPGIGGATPPEKSMGWLSRLKVEIPVRKTGKSSELIDRVFAEKLRSNLAEKTSRRFRADQASWGNEFRILRDDLLDDTSRIEKVLDWFCAHVRDRYTPVVGCAKTFRKKFLNLEAAYSRHLKDNPDVQVSSEAKKVADGLKRLRWPKGSGAKLDVACEVTLRGFKAVWAKLADYCKRNPRKVKTRAGERSNLPKYEWAHLVKAELSTAAHLTQAWLTNVFQSVADWDDWNGDLLARCFTGDLEAKGVTGILAPTCPPKVWAEIKEDLK